MKNPTVFLCSLAFSSALLASVSFAQPKAAKTKIYQHEQFRMSVPTDVAVTKNVMADFDVLSLTLKKDRLMGVYVGSNPDFPSDDAPEEKTVVASKINGFKAKSLQWQDKKGLYSGETLVEIAQEWAAVLHFFYRDISKENAQIAEKIIHSVQLNPKKSDGNDGKTFVPVN